LDTKTNNLLELSPFKVNKKLVQSYFECGDYFKELSENKVRELEYGETAEKGTMDVMGNSTLDRANIESNINRPSSQGLREQSQ
jgi:hypothetical protein